MNEQNRLRLLRMTARYERERRELGHEDVEHEAAKEAAFLRELARVRAEVLLPLIEEIGATLRRAGHDYRVESPEEQPSRLDFYLLIRGRSGSKDTIRFFVHNDAVRGREVVAHIILRQPIELTRFQWPGEITREAAEQLLVDAVEQLFASPAC